MRQLLKGAPYWLHPGELVCGDRGDVLETLLGSCVAILVTDRRHTIGAMCHIVHPHTRLSPPSLPTAHGDTALAALRSLIGSRGFALNQCDAWVAGGGNMFPDRFGPLPIEGNVGAANVDSALSALDRDGINVVGVDLGGNLYRRIRWTVGSAAPAIEAHTLADLNAPWPQGEL